MFGSRDTAFVKWSIAFLPLAQLCVYVYKFYLTLMLANVYIIVHKHFATLSLFTESLPVCTSKLYKSLK